MKQTPIEILDFLNTQKVCVLAVEMLDGSPHAATVHFAHSEDPLMFFFETYREYRKAEPILHNKETRASLVVGTDEATVKTFQLDGIVRQLKPEEIEHYDAIYFGKFPKKKEKSKDPKFLTFVFIPTWWRFTDFSEGKKILTS